jgi:hypothetical protein
MNGQENFLLEGRSFRVSVATEEQHFGSGIEARIGTLAPEELDFIS